MEIRKIGDYYDKVHEVFPELTMEQISTILNFGMRSFYKFNAYGADIYIAGKFLSFYIGKFIKDTNKFYEYWRKKSRIKISVLNKINKVKWDGYYYFGLSDELFEKYKNETKNFKGKDFVTFKNIIFYKLLDLAKLENYPHILRTKVPLDIGESTLKEEYTTKSYEYVFKRNIKTKHYEPVSNGKTTSNKRV